MLLYLMEPDIKRFWFAKFILHRNSSFKDGMSLQEIQEHLKPLLRNEWLGTSGLFD